MKNLLILMLGLIVSTASFAEINEPNKPATTQTRVVMTSDHKVKLFVQALQAQGKVILWDADGQIIYNSKVNLGKGLSQQFDISSLGTGTYHLSLLTGNQVLTKTFVMQANPNESFIVQEL